MKTQLKSSALVLGALAAATSVQGSADSVTMSTFLRTSFRRIITVTALILALGVGHAMAQRANGIDVSRYQGTINWVSVKGAGYTFAWAQATRGSSLINANFTANMSNGKAAGVLMGAYHFAEPAVNSPSTEANYFWNLAGPYIVADGKTLMPMLDVEVFTGHVGASSYSDWANQWYNAVVAKANAAGVTIKPVMYSSACSYCNMNSSSSIFGSWVANYSGTPQTGTPWSTCSSCNLWGGGYWNFWQYTSTGTIPGISGNVDHDVFNGTTAQLSTWVVKSATIPPSVIKVGVARTPSGQGYWIAASDGGVFSYGDAVFYGSMGGVVLSKPIVGIAAKPQGDGYWLVASDGGVFSFGAAPFKGSAGGLTLNQPVVGMAANAAGDGYWLVAKDGGIFSYNAPFNGSAGGLGINNIVGMTANSANGYILVGSDGGVFNYGANFYGSAGGQGLNDFVGIATKLDGTGYSLLRNPGAVYNYGTGYYGGANEPGNFTGMALTPSNNGYWLLKKDGSIYNYGDAPYKGGAN